jgi:short-subunit dehydrogenase
MRDVTGCDVSPRRLLMTGIAGLALVTGASCGAGFAVAEQFARRGYDLIVADGYDEINTAAAALGVLGTDIEAVEVDVRCVEQAHHLYERAMAAARPVVAAALITPLSDGSSLDGSLDSALEVVDANVRGTMLLARLLADEMATRGRGDIILTASPTGLIEGLDTAVYAASSAFLHAFTDMLQDKLFQTGVKITALMPDPVSPGGVGFVDILNALTGRVSASDPAGIARQAVAALTCNDKQGIAAWATDAMAALASRLVADDVKGPVRQIISPTGEAV